MQLVLNGHFMHYGCLFYGPNLEVKLTMSWKKMSLLTFQERLTTTEVSLWSEAKFLKVLWTTWCIFHLAQIQTWLSLRMHKPYTYMFILIRMNQDRNFHGVEKYRAPIVMIQHHFLHEIILAAFIYKHIIHSTFCQDNLLITITWVKWRRRFAHSKSLH